MASTFQYDPAIAARFPRVCGGVLLVHDVRNRPTSPEQLAGFISGQQQVRHRIGDTPLSQIAALAAWRGAFRAFGVDPTAIRSAAEALLRRLTKAGDIPSINALVDLGNLVSITFALPVAVFDLREVAPPITVRFAYGDERYRPFGAEAVEHPDTGEVAFVDTTGMVLARRWCWRQGQETAATEHTTSVIITVESQHEGGERDVRQAVEALQQGLATYFGASSEIAILDADHLSTPW